MPFIAASDSESEMPTNVDTNIVQPAKATTDSQFESLPIPDPLRVNIVKHYSEHLTATQMQVLPELLGQCHRDAIVRAKTGTGKTLSFLLPIVDKYAFNTPIVPNCRKDMGLKVCIITPTHELALQIHEELQQMINIPSNLLKDHDMKINRLCPGLIIGGDRKKSEKARIRKGLNILIATPGRLLDHLKFTQSLNMANLDLLVCDEGDRLFELGFENTIYSIFDIIMAQKKEAEQSMWHTWLFSATMPEKVERLATISLADPLRLNCSKEYEAPIQLKQYYCKCPTKQRFIFLLSIVDAFFGEKPRVRWMSELSGASDHTGYNRKLVVFVSTCKIVDFYRSAIMELYPNHVDDVYALHGDMNQKERSDAYLRFLKNDKGVLVTTDVSSRGLEFRQVDWIVQMDPPTDVQSYIHRVGRTARLDREGVAILVVQENEMGFVDYIKEKQLQINDMSPLIFSEDFQVDTQKKLEAFVEKETDFYNAAANAYMSFLRAYASHTAKSYFQVKDLHYGHLAKAFGLKDSPSQLTSRVLNEKKRHYDLVTRRKVVKRPRKAVSEFDNGLEEL